MAVYPFNLILAVATAAATMLFGFLPTKHIRSEFFAREAIKAALVWVCIALTSSSAIVHYPLIIAFLCFASFWQFRQDKALGGKMWLSGASGLGISLGVMLIVAVTPRAYPPDLTPPAQLLLLGSMYLGGAVIGLSYVCHALVVAAPTQSGITSALLQRHIGLLLILVIARAVILLLNFSLPSHAVGSSANIRIEAWLLLGIALAVLPTLAGMALRATRSRSRINPSLFVGICLVGLCDEFLARLLVL